MRRRLRLLALFLFCAARAVSAQGPVAYTVSFPSPQHHFADVEMVLSDLPAAPLQLRMSRSSPGRG